jgi:D-alanyl-D-alanine dipeptidase
MDLVEIIKISPKIRIELVYATPRNFTGKAIYPPSARALLVARAAERLHKVQMALEKRKLGLKIYDAYRPLSAQKILWQICPDIRFVADPSIGSKHNRGTAVDVTLVDALGRELPMPTPYDEFTERAHRSYRGCTSEEAKARDSLGQAMVERGFLPYSHEWWHFDDPDWESYPILDLPFGGA